MAKYIVKRVLIVIPTMLAVILIVFLLMNLTPSDPASVILGPNATQEAKDKLNHEFGYDQPVLVRYVNYVVNLVHGDMGTTYTTNREVIKEITMRFPVTLRLAASGILLAIILGVPLGIIAAVKRYSIFDILGTATSMLMASVPGFWLGLMLILLFSLKLGLLPSYGNASAKHYILPTITLALPVAASILRMTRTTMLEAIRQDYTRTARSKGQTERKVIVVHALRNALLPVITVAGSEFGFLLGGSVVIEQVCSINGVGKLLLEGIRMKDVPLVTGCAVFICLLFMLVMLLVDILYAFVDPRIRDRYSRKRS